MVSRKEERAIGADLAAVLPNDNTSWFKKPHLRQLNFCLFCLFLFSSANGYDGSMMNGLQALPQWHEFMDNPTGAWLGFINAVQALGAIALYPAVAWSNNHFGRKKSIAAGYFFLLLGTGLQAGANGSTMFILGRLFLGGTSAFYSVSAAVLITETAYPTHRGVYTALSNCGWYMGSLIAAWATPGTRNYATSWAWRVPSVLQLAVPAAALTGYIVTPKSPRWLISKGRHDEARAVLTKYHAGGDENSTLVHYELQEIGETLKLEAEFAKTNSWADMFRGKGNRHRSFISITLGIFGQWNGVGIASYYLAPVLITVGITSVTQQTLIGGFLQVWNLILAVAAAFSVDRLGRRKLFLTSCIGMLASFIAITGLSGSFANTGVPATGVAVIPFLFLFYGFYDIAFTPFLTAYPVEIWPYNLRARGLSMTLTTTQIAVFFNIFVNPIALEAIEWKYYIVYCAILVVITVTIYLAYPETTGHTLEDMARIFDGEAAALPKKEELRCSLSAQGGQGPQSENKSFGVQEIENSV